MNDETNFIPVKTEEDIAKLAILAEAIWKEAYHILLSKEQIDYMLGLFQSALALNEQINKQSYHYFFITYGGKTAGYMGYNIANGKLFLSKFYLQQDFRGKGISKSVFTFLNQVCAENKLSAIWLTVNKENNTAIAVYQKNGFQILREEKNAVGNGFYMDDYILEKEI